MPTTQMVQASMRGGEEVKLSKRTGDIVELRRAGRPRSAPTPPASPTCCSPSTVPRPSTSSWRSSPARRWTTRSSTCRWLTLELRSIQSQGRPRPASNVSQLADTDLALVPVGHERELEVLRQLSRASPTSLGHRRPGSWRRTRWPTWLREFAAAVHGFYHDCYVMGDDIAPELTAGPPRGWSKRLGSGLVNRPHAWWVCPHPTRCERPLMAGPVPLSASAARPRRPPPTTVMLTIGRRSCVSTTSPSRVRHAALRLRRGAPARPLP